MVVGLLGALLLVIAGPTVQGTGAPFPLANVAIVSIPLGFLAAIIDTLLGRPRVDADETFDRLTARVNAGA